MVGFEKPENDLDMKLWTEKLANQFTTFNGYHANSSDEVKIKLVFKLFETMPESIKKLFSRDKDYYIKRYLFNNSEKNNIDEIMKNPNLKKGFLEIYNNIFKSNSFGSFSKFIK